MRAFRLTVTLALLLGLISGAAAATFHFTVTSDPRQYDAAYDQVLAAVQAKVGGQGVFQVGVGDIDPPWNIRARIDSRFGTSAIWYPIIGNHEAETVEDMTWLRNEYDPGNGGRAPLKGFTNQDGPLGCRETTYSWDYANAHFIALNQYWNGQTAPGSDVARDGDVVPQLLDWLAQNIAATDKPVIIVFGHEPAYPQMRHVGDSLDKYPANRDAFWSLLESDTRVKAYVTAHTHFYSKHRQPGGRVWQFDAGNAGNDPGDGKTFIDVVIDDENVRFDVWRDGGTGNFALFESVSVPVQEPAPAEVDTPAAAKQMADGAYVRLDGIVSAAFVGFFYLEDADRTSGIRVNLPGHGFAAGSALSVTGHVSTTTDGEKYIDPVYYSAAAQAAVKPLAVAHRSLGGGDWGLDPGSGGGQRGVTGGVGLNNIGLLVRLSGYVTCTQTDHFYLDDGSGIEGPPGCRGVKVLTHGFAAPELGERVSLTGVVSMHRSGDSILPLVHASSGLPEKPFVAYNDCVWQAGQPIAPNVTTYGIGSGFTGSTAGPLLDQDSGRALPVTAALTQYGGVVWQPSTSTGGTDTAPGTDAYALFKNYCSLIGVIYYGSTGWYVDLEFSGLDPARSYDFATTANRGEPTYTNRLTKYTIIGADSCVNSSSSGATVTDGGISTTFCTGYNTVNGYVARWTNIRPGADGRFKVRAQVGAGGDAQKAYAFDAFRLAQTD